MKQLPNILTLGNLFCGALAIIFILQAPNYIAIYNGQDYVVTAPQPIYYATILIAVAAILDFLDGFAARLLRVQSPIGKELDSLADVITFGLAPGMILYQLLRSAYMQLPDAINVSIVNLSFALLIPCFAAYRLAKFNMDDRQKDHFIGVPTPAVGLLIASFPMILLHHTYYVGWLQNIYILYAIIFLLCFLMVARIPMFSLKFSGFSFGDNIYRYIFLLLGLAAIIIFRYLAVPFVFVLYIVLSLVQNFTKP